MQIEDFDFELPTDRIARHPADRRDRAKLMVLHRQTGTIEHRRFHELGEYFSPGDVFVLNDSRVIPARLMAKRTPSGGRVEILLTEPVSKLEWIALVHPGRKVHPGDRLIIEQDQFECWVEEELEPGMRRLRFESKKDFWENLDRFGLTPLPPYILKARRDSGEQSGRRFEEFPEDRERYQTVYARENGSVAAPTAGLHFSSELMNGLSEKGLQFARCTLHVGPGTFLPIRTDQIENHRMHAERFSIEAETCASLTKAREEGRSIIPVGTTSVRVLETLGQQGPQLKPATSATRLFIVPGFQFHWTDHLITNFHLPRSTLLMLVAAFAGKDFVLDAYRTAVKEEYRFYSYGDAMLIL